MIRKILLFLILFIWVNLLHAEVINDSTKEDNKSVPIAYFYNKNAYGRGNLPYLTAKNSQRTYYAYNTADSRIFKGDSQQGQYYMSGTGVLDLATNQWEYHPTAHTQIKNGTPYFLSLDHLGNTRAVVSNNIVEAQYDYYPYGKILRKWENVSSRYLSTKHEKDSETGYDDRKARLYDEDAMNFLEIDPLADKFLSMSPYTYVNRNPIKFVDPDGRSWEPFDKKGNVVKTDDYDNINGYRWVDYKVDEKGNKIARPNTVETAYTFGLEGMMTLSSEGFKPHKKWQDYSDISTGDKRADENIASLDPRVQNQMKAVVLELKLRYNIDVRGGAQGGFRTYEQQDEIYSRGASKARGGQSNHNFAIAMDVAIYENGKYLSKGSEKQYSTYGSIAKERGLMWGGDWKSFFDPAHIEHNHNLTMRQLRSLPKDINGFFVNLP